MKHIFPLFTVLALLTACSDDDAFDQGGNSLTFHATTNIEDSTLTRTTLGGANNHSVYWSEGDAISIFTDQNDNNTKMTLSSGAGTQDGIFKGSCEKATTGYYAVYPYNAANAKINVDGCHAIQWNGSKQTAVLNSFSPETPMAAYAAADGSNDVNLYFKNLCPLMKFTTNYKCKEIWITAHNDCVIAADEVIACWNANDGSVFTSTRGSGTSKITVKGKDGADIEAGTYYIAALSGTMDSGLSVTVTSCRSDKKVWAKSTTKSVKLTQNKILNLGSFDFIDIVDLQGAGTKESPYQISNFTELRYVQKNIENGTGCDAYYVQTADLDAEGQSMAAIGTVTHPFTGVYDGQSHKISNMTYSGSVTYVGMDGKDRQAVALFGAIKDATICNLEIDNPTLSAPTSTNRSSLSPFVGVAYSSETGKCKLSGCKVFAESQRTVSTSYSETESGSDGLFYGGIIADNQANVDISECTNQMNIEFDLNSYRSALTVNVGGIIGCAVGVNDNFDSDLETDGFVSINKCHNNANLKVCEVSNDEKNAYGVVSMAGIIGKDVDFNTDDDVCCNLKNCVNKGRIECISLANIKFYLAGIIGNHDSDGMSGYDPSIENCINLGYIGTENNSKITAYVGGILGYCYDSNTKVRYCANSGTMTAALTPNSICQEGHPTVYYFWNTTDWNQTKKDVYSGPSSDFDQYYIDKSPAEIAAFMNNLIETNSDFSSYCKWTTLYGMCDLDF